MAPKHTRRDHGDDNEDGSEDDEQISNGDNQELTGSEEDISIEGDEESEVEETQNQDHSKDSKGTKRKRSTKSQFAPSKTAKHSEQKEDKTAGHNDKDQPEKKTRGNPSSVQHLNFLLSPSALPLCRPADEAEELDTDFSKLTYTTGSAHFTPFQELLCAVILSRPISHRLGARTIRTLFNTPHNLTSPQAIRDAGAEKLSQALWDARTQHKNKTAEKIDALAQVVLEKFAGDDGGESLEVVRQSGDMQKQRALLKESINGLGDTGLDIFFRRIQWKWEDCYPFVDDKTKQALGELELLPEAGDLDQWIGDYMNKLQTPGHEDREGDERRRSVFVVLLERAVGAHLEGNTEKVFSESGNT